jgi:hypothetical protein
MTDLGGEALRQDRSEQIPTLFQEKRLIRCQRKIAFS